ncbi:hypothetical protein KY290_026098 [Solanum tuberosum]|uniref:DUF4283 domain-containing protein n=1 Tax=Solanum tuberosum TaxID=4113 RepID=A0ABQ7UXE6_SOLTU|nr:hypothetical protein KY289_025194 [Solanum tuberosum]KAH0673880.1 hypothetical protein KY284_024967 [Solanum tuberosum]KAH0755828.1 hypothetical protein KY290_026098 [Solanum tuberosum]
MIRQIPICVKFPKLPVGYWSVEAFSKVASAVGNRLHTDNFTANAEKISYDRILIEVDVSQPFPDCIAIETPSGPWTQPVEYEWRPKFCDECIRLGHTTGSAGINMKLIWRRKEHQ